MKGKMEDKNKTFGPVGASDTNQAAAADAARATAGQAGTTSANQAGMTIPSRVGITNATGRSDAGRPANTNPIVATAAAQSNAGKDAAPVAAASEITQPVAKKRSNAMLLGLILCAILAAGGIGFGAWAMVDSNTQKANYEKRVSELTSQNNELANKIENSSNIDDCVVIEDDGGVSTEENTAEYIYVGQWGLKIKIPDNLTVTGYRYSMSAGYDSIGVVGNTKGGQYFPEFADFSKTNSALGIVSRYSVNTDVSSDDSLSLVFSDSDYNYYYTHPQAAISTLEDEQKWESESIDTIEQMLKNADNYSAF